MSKIDERLEKLALSAKRVYNNNIKEIKGLNGEVKGTDEDGIKCLVAKAFNANSNTIANEQAFRDLNQLIAITADMVEEPDYQKFLNLICDYKKVGVNDTVIYKTNYRQRVTSYLTATGAGVDFTRIPKHRKQVPATPIKHQFGIKYSISEMVSDPVNEFKNAVDLLNKEKLVYRVSQVYNVMRKASAVSTRTIPQGQIVENAGISFSDFQGVENRLIRFGGGTRPVFMADISMLTDLQMKQASVTVPGASNIPLYLNDEMRVNLLRNIGVDFISKSVTIALDNPYTSLENDKVKFPINEGFMVAGGSEAPIKVTDYGDTAVLENSYDSETEEANVKYTYKMDVTLFLNRAVGYFKDTSISDPYTV